MLGIHSGVSKPTNSSVCLSSGSFLPPQVSYPARERFSGLCDEWSQRHDQQQPLSAWSSGRQWPPVAQLSTDSGKETTLKEVEEIHFN